LAREQISPYLGKNKFNFMKYRPYLLSTVYLSSLLLAIAIPSFQTAQANSDPVAVETPAYKGIVAQIDQIAQQITVRIDSAKHGNGSGVIIAKNSDTYYRPPAKVSSERIF
jgi:hypothetical protein